MKNKTAPTYDGEALGVLAYEFPFSDKAEAEDKIRKRLKRKKLGDFDPDRILLLRRFKDQVQMEVGKQAGSSYYRGPADDKVRLQKYVELNDFDVPRLTADMIAAYPGIAGQEIEWFVRFAVSIYHML
jgi:hypothetical protein